MKSQEKNLLKDKKENSDRVCKCKSCKCKKDGTSDNLVEELTTKNTK